MSAIHSSFKTTRFDLAVDGKPDEISRLTLADINKYDDNQLNSNEFK